METNSIELTSIADHLNVYLRENQVGEIEKATMQEIKKGIDRLADSAVYYRLHWYQAKEVLQKSVRYDQ